MALPGHRFGAHERDAPAFGKRLQFIHDDGEVWSQHEISVGAKGADLPGGVRRIDRRFAKAAQIAAPEIVYARAIRSRCQRLTIKMRMTLRRRPAADVDE